MIWESLSELDEEVKIIPTQTDSKNIPYQTVPAGKSDWALSSDVFKKNGNLVVKINLPGINPEKLDIDVSMDSIKVSGTSEDEEKVDGKDYFLKEIRKGNFERIIKLPVRIEMDKAEADYTKGILKITVPLRQENLINKIKVQSKSN